MTAHREADLLRMVVVNPERTEAQHAYILGISPEDFQIACLGLERRGVLERTATGWQRRRSAVRA